MILVGMVTLSAQVFGQSAAKADELLRFRMARTRDVAVQQQNERVLGELLPAARRLSRGWDAVATGDKQKLVEKCEKALGLLPVDRLPDGTVADKIPFAVPRKEFLDVAFKTLDGVEPGSLSLDIYSPGTDRKHPVIIWSHGGGFVGGDKAHPLLSAVKPDCFVSQGFVFVSLNYRLAPQHKFPAQGYDTAAALAFLHDNVAKYGGDPHQLFLIGDSAGGQLVSIVSTNETFLKHYQKSLDIIRGTVVLDIGSFDVPSIMDSLGKNAPKQYHDTFRDNRDDWIAASPMLHVSPGKKIPSMLLIYVSGRQHHAEENERFASKLKEHGYKAEVYEAKDRTHHTLAYNIGIAGDPATEQIMKFFTEQSRNKEH